MHINDPARALAEAIALGARLLKAADDLGGGRRVDLLSEDASVTFYERFPHFRKPGYRLYPFHESGEDLASQHQGDAP